MKIKTCTICGIDKSISDYYIKPNGVFVYHYCKSCVSKKKHEYRNSDYNRVRSLEDNWRKDNKEKCLSYYKKYRESNKEICNYRTRRYYTNNIDEQRNRISNKRAKRLQRMPSWLSSEDISKIKSIYKMAHNLSEKTGILHHVDHIVPLQGKHVSGLHVPWNLQVISAFENLSKGNSFDEDMV